jgi:HSP20 family protein
MTALTPFDRLDSVLPDIFRRMSLQLRPDTGLPTDIRIDVSETEKEYLVSAELPGARKDDIRVVVDGNYVSISADVKKDIEDKHADKGRAILKETYRGSIGRAFALGQEVDDKAAVAKFEDGVLRLTLPKRAGSSSRLLPIQ